MVTAPIGICVDKLAVMSEIRQAAEKAIIGRYDKDDLKVRAYGDTAVSSYRMTAWATVRCSMGRSSRRRRCYDGNPRTRVEHGTRVPHVSVRFTHEGSASNANESRLRVGCHASGGARLGPDVTGAEAGTGISAGGMTPTTSDAT